VGLDSIVPVSIIMSIVIAIGTGETCRRNATVILHAIFARLVSLFAPFESSESARVMCDTSV